MATTRNASSSNSPRGTTGSRPQLEMLEDRMLLSGGPPPESFLGTPLSVVETNLAMHIHPHLTIIIDGQTQVIPSLIGISGQYALPIHTHDTSGTIHVESTAAYDFRLKDFFLVWDQPFDSQHILGYTGDAQHPVTLTVNGQTNSSFENVVMHDGDNIVIQADSLSNTATLAPNPAFVTQVYRDLLHRNPDSTGLTKYVSQLDTEMTSRDQLIQTIRASSEYRSVVVQDLYSRFLHRQADPGGLQAATAFLGAGGTVEQVEAIITGSPEYFQNRGGGTNDGFLNALYADVLNRAADPVGKSGFGQALAAGASQAQIASALFGSAEFRQNLVSSFYRQYLHRDADAGGLSYFTNSMQQGASDGDIIAGLLVSNEYFNRR